MTDGLTDRDRAGIRSVLAENPRVRRAVLFGSRALGTYRGASDVDLALEGRDLGLQDLLSLKAQIDTLSLPVEVDLVIRATIGNAELKKHIKTYGQEWYRQTQQGRATAGDWQDITLGDFVTLQRGHDLTEPERRLGRVPVMGSAGQNGFHDTVLAKGPGIVIGRSGASFGQVHFSKVDFWPHNTALYVTDFKGNDPLFAFYFLKSLDFDRFNSGSAQPSLNRNFIYPIPIRVPRPDEQKAIAAVLGALDDKIELNRRMNATLEAMARALFQSWFVDFDPVRAKLDGRKPARLDKATAELFPNSFQDSPLGHIPKGWETGSILRQADLLSGGTPKTDVPAYWCGDVPWASAKDVSQCGEAFLISTERTITKKGVDESSTKMMPAKTTVVVARGATTGRLTMFGHAMAMNQTCYGLRSKIGAPFALYCNVRHFIERLVQGGHGSIFDTITTSTFEATDVLLAPKEVLLSFDTQVTPLFRQVHANLRQSRTLATLRDTLLPKLLSGELSVAASTRQPG